MRLPPLLVAPPLAVLLGAATTGTPGAAAAGAPARAAVATGAPAAQAGPARPAVVIQADPHDAGLLVLATLPGTGLDGATRDLVARQRLAGVVLFGRNVRSAAQVRALSRALHAAAGPRGFLVTTDQEGGPVRRLPFAQPVASAQQAGRAGPAAVQRLSSLAGRQMRSAGVDVDLAPDADLPAHAAALAGRSYGAAPAADVAAAVTGLRQGGVGATAKHFPGLGGAAATTDDRPVLLGPVRGPQLVPFRAAARAGAGLVMVGLATYRGLTRGPAALDPATYRLLRGPQVGFRGVAVTDALVAGAARAVGSQPEAAVRAVAAGADLVLTDGGPAAAAQVVAALQRALRTGRISAARWEEATARVRLLLARPSAPPPGRGDARPLVDAPGTAAAPSADGAGGPRRTWGRAE